MRRSADALLRQEEPPAGWTEVTLAELGMGRTQTIEPSAEPKTEFELWSVPTFPTGKPEIALGSTVGSNKQRVQEGDVLLCKINPRINRVWRVAPAAGRPQIASTEWIVFRSHLFHPDFLMWRFREGVFRDALCRTVAGVGGSLTRARPMDVAKLTIELPPLAEQRRIVARLEQLEARSRRARAALADVPALLAQARQSLLAAAFRGDLTKDWRKKHPIDARWIASTVGDVIESVKYGTAVKCCYEQEGTPVLRIPNIKDGAVSQQDLKFAELDKRELESLCLEAGDILIIRSNGSLALVGSAALVSEAEEGFSYAGYLIRLRVDPEKTDPAFLTHAFNSPVIRQQVNLAAHSTSGVNNINSEELRSLSFRLPPLAEQREIVRRLERALARLDAAAAAYAAAVAELDRLDQSLLARAFRGKLVPQDPADEPAAKLLARLPDRLEASSRRPTRTTPGESSPGY